MKVEDVPYLEQGRPFLAIQVLAAPGRRRYLLEVENGKIVQLTEAEQDTTRMNLPMRDAARRLRHSYSWLSRNWRSLGMKPSRLGRVLFFRSDDLDAMLARESARRAPGRSKKIIGVLNAPS